MTIYDIAREAGVSASSVSRVINRRPGVNAETRKRILALLEKYNYTPNSIARGLVNQNTGTIGVLVSDIRTLHHANSAYYIEQELAARGISTIILNTGHEVQSRIGALETLKTRCVDGAVLIGSAFQTEELARAIERLLGKIPVVIINGYLDLPNVYGILIDDRNGVEKCVYYLADKGHKRLAFVRNSDTPSSFLKEQGFINGMKLLYPGKPYYWVYTAEDSLQGGYEATQRILDEHPNVEGIIYAVDLLGVGGVRALIDRGVEIPARIAVMGIDNSIYCEICIPRMSSMDSKLKDSSVMAARVLMELMEGKKQPTNKIMLFSSIVERETT